MERIKGMDSKAMDLVNTLVDYGWTGRVTSKGHWLGKAPDGKTTITVPAKMDNPSRAEANARAVFKKWVRETFPEVAEALDRVTSEEDPTLQAVLEGQARRKVHEIAEEPATQVLDRERQKILNSVEWPIRKPWLAHKASNKDGGTRYESEAVIERLWNNGDIDYECAYPGCGYVSDNPRGVAVHYGRAHTMKGETPPATQDKGLTVDPEYTEPIMERSYKPTDRLILALAAVLEKLNGHGTDREKAEEILRWFHDRPDIEHTTRPSEPLTDAEIVFRIRRLVSPGMEDTLKAAQAEIAAIQQERDTLRVERDLALAQLAKVSRDLDGIKELIGEVGR